MLKDDFKRLMDLFVQSAEGKQVDLQQVFSESLEFFEGLKDILATGSPEDKKEAITLMGEMYSKMMSEVKGICEKTGMTEEQLVSYAENPANFSSEQWNAIKSSKDQIMHVGKDLAKMLGDSNKPETSGQPQKPENKRPKEKKSRKSEWMRS